MNEIHHQSLLGTHRAALVLLGIGEEAAGAVLKHLAPREILRLHEAMSDLNKIGPRVAAQTLRDFLVWLHKNNSLRFCGASDFIRRAAVLAVGEENAKELLGGGRATGDAEETTQNAFYLLEGVDPRVLSSLLQKEHQQTAALVLAHMEHEKSAEVLSHFPEPARIDILVRIAKLDTISPDTVREVASVIELELAEFAATETGAKVSGATAVANIMTNLSGINKNMANDTLSGIEDIDLELANEIKQGMFTFEHMERLDDRSIQALLREIDGDTLVKSLRSTPETLKEKILGNMSARAAQMIRDDLENAKPMRVSEIMAAQAEIVRIALTMEAEGRIELPNTAANDEFV